MAAVIGAGFLVPDGLSNVTKILFEAPNVAVVVALCLVHRPEYGRAMQNGGRKRSLVVPVLIGAALVGALVILTVRVQSAIG